MPGVLVTRLVSAVLVEPRVISCHLLIDNLRDVEVAALSAVAFEVEVFAACGGIAVGLAGVPFGARCLFAVIELETIEGPLALNNKLPA